MHLQICTKSPKVTHKASGTEKLNQFSAVPQLMKLSINKPGGHVGDQVSRQGAWAEKLLEHVHVKDPRGQKCVMQSKVSHGQLTKSHTLIIATEGLQIHPVRGLMTCLRLRPR